MAAHEDRVSRATDGASIALLRRLRAGAEISYVHHFDVCSAAPADLVFNLTPAPGTDQTDDGYNSIWYFYYPKRYKNTQGKATGYRHRAIDAPGEETSWHSEISARNVRGSGGGTFCTFSYGRRKDGSLERMGWSMVEYDDFVDEQADNVAASNYVLCKVYRPSRSKGKGKTSSSSSKSTASSSSSKTARDSSCSKSKRKGSCGNPEAQARPAKVIHIQRDQVQVQMQHDSSEFVQTEYGPMPSQLAHITVDEWIDCQDMFGDAGEEQALQLQQPCAEPEQAGEFIQMSCGVVVPAVAEATLEDMLGSDMMSGESTGVRTACTPVDDGFFVGVDPVVPVVVPELTVEDLLGAEMVSGGECISMATAGAPPDDDFFAGVFGSQEDARSRASSSSAPRWSMAPSSSTGCSILVQEPPPLWLPYLMCS